jgi:hypothetical protein
MKIWKCLVAGLATCNTYANSVFYVGINTGINHGKYLAKNDEKKSSISKTRTLLEGVLGYEYKFDALIAGFDLEIGNSFGTMKNKSEDTYEIQSETPDEIESVTESVERQHGIKILYWCNAQNWIPMHCKF